MERGTSTRSAVLGQLRTVLVAASTLCLTGPAGLPTMAADEPRAQIVDMEVSTEEQGYLVSFRLQEVMPEEVLERIHSGIPVSFEHKVDLLAKRTLPLMPAKTLCRSSMVTTVSYESLTQEYLLTRSFEYQARGEDGVFRSGEERLSTGSSEDMIGWMTEIRDLFVPFPVKKSEEARRRLRTTVTLGRRFVLLMFPTSHTVSVDWPLER